MSDGTEVGRAFGEEGRRLDYGSYLRLGELLSLQTRLTDEHDELLFIVVHQVYELWFTQLLFELEHARTAMDADDVRGAGRAFKRVSTIERLLVQQVDVLETMGPSEFAAFRSRLAPASGFQSVQFREIEFLSGSKDAAYLDRLDTDAAQKRRLERRLVEPSLWDAFVALVQRQGSPSLGEILADRDVHGALYDLSEALLDHDEAFALWRSRHVLMVERQIGSQSGTGGSSGARYLRGTLAKRFYPELWAVRDQL
jgi:tryptophan 2,3-dioxygenase